MTQIVVARFRTDWNGKYFSAHTDLEYSRNYVLEHSNNAEFNMDGLSDAIETAKSWNSRKSQQVSRDNQRAKNQAYRDCGMKRVRGALGGVYWE